jgi:hypothetical protein
MLPMYRTVLIVDDEQISRHLLKNCPHGHDESFAGDDGSCRKQPQISIWCTGQNSFPI